MADLRSLWASLVGSLWFVPGVMVLGAILLAAGMVELSALVDEEVLSQWPRVFGASAESSRSMLSAIASSMITVAGVTFSITMVAVTQASSQYTPRILRNFMRDRANQVVLGSFVGIFAYCLVVLRTVRGGDDEATFIPSLAVLLAILLAILGIGVLIFFIHHIATTLQASEIVHRVSGEAVRLVDRLYPDPQGAEVPDAEPAAVLAAVAPVDWRPVPARATGYLQFADVDGMLALTREAGLIVRVERTIGEFVVEGLPLAWHAPHPAAGLAGTDGRSEDVGRRLAAMHTVRAYRTIAQDPAFGIRQLVDIALKALSPGINDTTTAVTCVDHLSAILVRVADRRIEASRRSEDGVLRIVAPGPTFEGLLDLAYTEIRQSADGNASILIRQVETLALIGGATRSAARRGAVLRHLDLVRDAGAQVRQEHDRDTLGAAVARARHAVGPG